MQGLLYLWYASLSLLYCVCIISLCTTDRHKYFLVVTLKPLWWFMFSCESPTDRFHLLSGFSCVRAHVCACVHTRVVCVCFYFCTIVITCILLLVFPMMSGLCGEGTDPEWSSCPNFTGWEVLQIPRTQSTAQDRSDTPAPARHRTDAIFSVKPNPAPHSIARRLLPLGTRELFPIVISPPQNSTLGHFQQWFYCRILVFPLSNDMALGQLILSHV